MITRRKIQYPVQDKLRDYLGKFGRQSDIPLVYNDLLHFTGAFPYENPKGDETLWLTVFYPPDIMEELREKLTRIYTALKIGVTTDLHEHLVVDRIDFGEFGNSRPFRIKIINKFNDNADYYYVKVADASRLYGLELEHILSPKRINYLVNGNTLIEDHVAGVPGNDFLENKLDNEEVNSVRIAKEFTKFNERCFVRLLGDMRSVNYVVDITPDFEEVQYRVRPIDFDQQSYEKNLKIYQAFTFASNRSITKLSFKSLNRKTIHQYAMEERSQMARRAASERRRLAAILSLMKDEELAPRSHVKNLAQQLEKLHQTQVFHTSPTMGDLTARHIQFVLNLHILDMR